MNVVRFMAGTRVVSASTVSRKTITRGKKAPKLGGKEQVTKGILSG